MAKDEPVLIEYIYNVLREIENTDPQKWFSAVEIRNLLSSNEKKAYMPSEKMIKHRIYSKPLSFFPDEVLVKAIASALEDLKKIGEITKLYKIDVEKYDEKVPGLKQTTKYHYKSNISREVMRLMYEACAGIEGFPFQNRKDLYNIIKILYGKDYADKTKDTSYLPEDDNNPIKMMPVLSKLYKIMDQIQSKSKEEKEIYIAISIKYCNQKMIVLPLKVIVYQGCCYLLCKEKRKKNLSLLNVDMITDVWENKTRLFASDYQKLLNEAEKYIKRKKSLTAEVTKEVDILFDKEHINEVLDWFGNKIKIIPEKDGRYSARVRVTKEEFVRLIYTDWLEMTGPDEVVSQIKKMIIKAAKKYGKKA